MTELEKNVESQRNLKISVEKRILELKNEKNSQIFDLKNVTKMQKNEIGSLKLELESVKNANDSQVFDLKNVTKIQKNEIDSLKSELESVKNANDSQIYDLKSVNEIQKNEIDSLKSELESMKNDLKNCHERINYLEEDNQKHRQWQKRKSNIKCSENKSNYDSDQNIKGKPSETDSVKIELPYIKIEFGKWSKWEALAVAAGAVVLYGLKWYFGF